MKVSSISQNKYISPKTTGYAATGGLVLSMYSGLCKNRTMKKIHKPASYFTAIMTAIHIALVEYNSYKYKNKNPKR